MKKAIRITAVIAMIAQLCYLIFGRLVGPLVVSPLFNSRSSALLMGNDTALVTYIIIQVVMGGIVLLAYVLFGIIMIFQADGKSEKIVPEIISLVFLCAIIPLLSTGGSYLTNLIFSQTKGAMYLATFSLLNSGIAFFGFIQTISYLGIIMSITMSICNKKFVIPLEYELGRGIETEETQMYGNTYNDPEYNAGQYGQQQYSTQQYAQQQYAQQPQYTQQQYGQQPNNQQ